MRFRWKGGGMWLPFLSSVKLLFSNLIFIVRRDIPQVHKGYKGSTVHS